MNITNGIGLVAWGLKLGYDVFFTSDNISREDPEIKKTLEDIRGLVSFSRPGQTFYSLEFTNTYKAFTGYRTIYDWAQRGNAYLAMSVFVPYSKRLTGPDPKTLIDQLLETYASRYVNEQNQIKREKEDPELFFPLINKAKTESDQWSRKRPNSEERSDYAVVRYKSDADLVNFFSNPYRNEYQTYKEIFFLAENNEVLRTASSMKEISDLKPLDLSFQLEFKPEMPAAATALPGDLKLSLNGQILRADSDGVYRKTFFNQSERVHIRVESKEFTFDETAQVSVWQSKAMRGSFIPLVLKAVPKPPPKPEPKHREQVAEPHTPAKDLPEKMGVRFGNGPRTYTLIFSDEKGRSLDIADLQKAEIYLDGQDPFRPLSPVVKLQGLQPGQSVRGRIVIPGYQSKPFQIKASSDPEEGEEDMPIQLISIQPASKIVVKTSDKKRKKDPKPAGPGLMQRLQNVSGINMLKVILVLAIIGLIITAILIWMSYRKENALDARKQELKAYAEALPDKFEEDYLGLLTKEVMEYSEALDTLLAVPALQSDSAGTRDFFRQQKESLESSTELIFSEYKGAVQTDISEIVKAESIDSISLDTAFMMQRYQDYLYKVDERIQLYGREMGGKIDSLEQKRIQVEQGLEAEEAEKSRIQGVANSTKLKSSSDYQRLINQATSLSLDRVYIRRLQAMNEVANAYYIKRTEGLDRIAEGQGKLEELKTDSRLTPAQQRMVKGLAEEN